MLKKRGIRALIITLLVALSASCFSLMFANIMSVLKVEEPEKPKASSYSWYGSGTSGDPYLIKNIDQLEELSDAVNSGTDFDGVYFELVNDLDFGKSNFIPIGGLKGYSANANTFQGVFDGGYHTISNVSIENSETGFENIYAGLGLFGAVSHNAVIKNLAIKNFTVDGDNGKATNDAMIGGGIVGCIITGVADYYNDAALNPNHSGKVEIYNCIAENVTFQGFGKLSRTGGIVGVVGIGVASNNSYAGFNLWLSDYDVDDCSGSYAGSCSVHDCLIKGDINQNSTAGTHYHTLVGPAEVVPYGMVYGRATYETYRFIFEDCYNEGTSSGDLYDTFANGKGWAYINISTTPSSSANNATIARSSSFAWLWVVNSPINYHNLIGFIERWVKVYYSIDGTDNYSEYAWLPAENDDDLYKMQQKIAIEDENLIVLGETITAYADYGPTWNYVRCDEDESSGKVTALYYKAEYEDELPATNFRLRFLAYRDPNNSNFAVGTYVGVSYGPGPYNVNTGTVFTIAYGVDVTYTDIGSYGVTRDITVKGIKISFTDNNGTSREIIAYAVEGWNLTNKFKVGSKVIELGTNVTGLDIVKGMSIKEGQLISISTPCVEQKFGIIFD